MISKILFRFATVVAVLFLLTSFPQVVRAQVKKEQFIKAGIIAGVNFCQIEGDGYSGYNLWGVNAGGTAMIKFHPNWSVGFELLYEQKGSRQVPTEYNGYAIRKIRLGYITVPLLLNYHDYKHGGIFSGGFSYGTLVRSFENDYRGAFVDPIYYPFRKSDIDIVAGFSFFLLRKKIKDKLAVNLRGYYSILPIRFSDVSTYRNRGQYNDVLALRLMWLINN